MTRNHIGQFGESIRNRRRLLNLTQKQLARKINASALYIGHLESGKRHPSEKMIKQLAEALSLDAGDLFFLANPGIKRLISQPDECHGASTAWEIFQKDENLRAIHKISDQEMQALSRVALLGQVREPNDFIFILNAIRQALI